MHFAPNGKHNNAGLTLKNRKTERNQPKDMFIRFIDGSGKRSIEFFLKSVIMTLKKQHTDKGVKIMKRTITAILLTLCFAAAVPFAGCAAASDTKKPDSPSVNNTPDTGTVPGETFSPNTQTLAGNYADHINEAGIKSCDADFVRVEYDASLKNPCYYIAEKPDDFIKQITGRLSESASHRLDIDKYGESYFEKFSVIVLRIPASSGSLRFSLSRVSVKDNVISVYVNTIRPEMGTTDMATFAGLISLYKTDFKEDSTIEVYLNNTLLSADSFTAAK